jgi:hypothetical protein
MMEYWSSGIVEKGKDFCITYHMGVISPAVDTIFPLMARNQCMVLSHFLIYEVRLKGIC